MRQRNLTASRWIVALAALGWALTSSAPGCTCGEVTRGILGEQCELNTECDAPLVCRLQRCRKECATPEDCPPGAACVVDENGLGACQLDDERDCDLDSECPGVLVCRGHQCVNECAEDRDCVVAGARCLAVEGGMGCIDQSSIACVSDSECADGFFCLGLRCRLECYTDRDCGGRWVCHRGVNVCCDPEPGARPEDECPPPDARRDAGPGGGADAGPGGGTDAGPGGGTDAGPGGTDAGMPPLGCSGAPLTGVRELTVGGSHACVIRGTGAATEVLCWGGYGDIGDGGPLGAPCPTPVPALAGQDIVHIDAGGVHTCAVLASGAVWCWGVNNSGELGRGTFTMQEPPAVVPGVTATGVVASWTNTCTWQTGGAAMCWGSNLWGSLGIGPCRACMFFIPEPAGGDYATPQTVTVVSQPQDLALGGGGHTCGIVSGAVECWGKSGEGQLGMAGGTMITDAIDVAAGESFSCAVRGGDGSVHCWGDNYYGTLGDGTTTSREMIAPVVGLPGPAASVDASNHTCATLMSGAVYCWGNAMAGRVRPGLDAMAEPTPQMVIASGATNVEVGALFNCAQVGDEVRCWGANSSGQLGIGSMDPVAGIATVAGP